jgi:hypothetical protein
MKEKELIEGCYFDTGSGCIRFQVNRCTNKDYLKGYPQLNIQVENRGQKLNEIEFIVDPNDLKTLGEMLIRISESGLEKMLGFYPYIPGKKLIPPGNPKSMTLGDYMGFVDKEMAKEE